MPLHHERRGRERECQAQALGAEIPIALPPAGRAAMVTDEECVTTRANGCGLLA
jgi:hypothetical protein